MFENDSANRELVLLMLQFAAASSRVPAQRAGQQAFYNRVRRPIEDEALYAAGFNRDIAAVAVQETWVKILRSAHTYDASKASVTTWVKLLARQCVTDELRKYYKHHPTDSSGATVSDDNAGPEAVHSGAACPRPSGEEQLYAKQILTATAACLDKLQASKWPNIQLAYTLYLDSDLTYEEVLQQMREVAPPSAVFNSENVRSWVNRARDQMRACLKRKLDLSGGIYE